MSSRAFGKLGKRRRQAAEKDGDLGDLPATFTGPRRSDHLGEVKPPGRDSTAHQGARDEHEAPNEHPRSAEQSRNTGSEGSHDGYATLGLPSSGSGARRMFTATHVAARIDAARHVDN